MTSDTQRDLPWWSVLWRYSLFEGADSAWSLIVVSTYFSTLIQVSFARPASTFGWTITVANLVIALAAPLLGAAADETGRRQPYLRICVVGVAVFTAAIGFLGTLWSILASFALAYIAVSAGFMFFTAMLPAVSSARNVGTVTSMSVGVGYACGLVCITLFGRLVATDADVGRVFLPMALVYAALAVPTMFMCPDFRRQRSGRLTLSAPFRHIGETIRQARRYKPLFRFLIGDFLYENAVASVITLTGLYARNVMGFSAGELKGIFGPALVIAALSAWLVFRPLMRTIGPKWAVLATLALWLVLFGVIAAVRPETTLHLGSAVLTAKTLFPFVVAPLAGIGLAGVWSTSRVLLTALTPVEKSGEFWGLYNLSGRTATLLGDATWTVILSIFGEGLLGYDLAIGALAIYVLLGAVLIAGLPDARPGSANFLDREAGEHALAR